MNIKTLILACWLALCLLAQPAVAGPLEDGQAAYDVRDYANALKLWRPLAEQGDAVAQDKIGNMYWIGEGLPPSYEDAAKWFRLAAEQGNVDAQSSLGFFYREGKGVPQDYFMSVKWYRLAADQGRAFDQNVIGEAYENGQGVLQDYSEAVKWYQLSADQGFAFAQNNLGQMYESGRGVLQDYKLAYVWYNLSAARYRPLKTIGPEESFSEKFGRKEAIEYRDLVAAKMTLEQIAEAQRLARGWTAAHPKK